MEEKLRNKDLKFEKINREKDLIYEKLKKENQKIKKVK